MVPHHSDKIDYYTLNIGEKDCFCIKMTIKINDTVADHYLDRIESSGKKCGCTLDNTLIRGEKTRKMMYFAATLIKEISPTTRISFTDQSSFPCTLKDGTERNVPLNLYAFMFKGKTWYDEVFGARLKEDKYARKYHTLQQRRMDPNYKPERFVFYNEYLTEQLTPLYESSASWADFFEKITAAYGNNKCVIVYLWIHRAIQCLTVGDHDIFGFQEWVIDAKEMPEIPYTIKAVHNDGSFYTRKHKVGGFNKKRRMTRKSKWNMKDDSEIMRDMIPRSEDYDIFDRHTIRR